MTPLPAISSMPIFDGHNDTKLDLDQKRRAGQSRSFFVKSEEGHIDLPRALAGGLGGGFFALFTPSPKRQASSDGTTTDDTNQNSVQATLAAPAQLPVGQGEALRYTLSLAAQLFQIEKEAAGQAKIVRDVNELIVCLQEGIFAMILHIEGAEAIDENLDALYVLHQAGLRSLGLTWSRDNIFAHGVPFKFPGSPDTGPGLTETGKDLVRTCNQLGIMLDLSHLNEQGFWDVEALSKTPLVATHSCAYALSSSPRNLTDKQLDAVRATNGVVGANYHVGFLREDGRYDLETSLVEIVRHVDYMVERMGIDHVALGSDFDGATMPDDLVDVTGLPKLMDTFREHGYDDSALRKIAYENWVRVLQETWVP